MNDPNLKALREPKSKYYRLIQVLAIICLVFGVALFCCGFVFQGYFGVFLHIALVLVALGCGGLIVLPWVNVLERDKRLKEEGYPVIAWRKYLGFGFVAAIAVCVALWIVAVFIVHVDTFAALFERAFGEETAEHVIEQENVLKFLCFAILLTIQVCVASAITASAVRYQKKFLTIRIISYVALVYLDIWVSWIIGLLFFGTLVAPLEGEMIWLATPLDIPMLVIGFLALIAFIIIMVALDKMVYRERMDLFTQGIGAAYTATDDDILQGTYDATVSLDEAETKRAPAVGGRKRRPAPSAPPAEEKSVEEQLERIRELRDKGILTEEEYQAKRKDIIDKM